MRTDFLQVAALVESGPVRLDQHETDPLGSCGRIGLCRQNNEVAANSVGNENLLSVDDVMVPILMARVLIFCTSLPPLGSVMPKAPIASPFTIRGSHVFLSSSFLLAMR